MPDTSTLGKWIVLVGLALVVLGGAIWLAGRFGLPLGRLPGDIRLEGKNFSFYFPIATSILFSLFVTLALNLIARLWRK